MITRIYTGDDGQSHFEDLDMDSGPFQWGQINQATGVIFNQGQSGSFSDWHNAPRRQFVITLRGEMEIGIADGTLKRFGPGSILFADDLTGQGHTTRDVGSEPRLSVSVPIP